VLGARSSSYHEPPRYTSDLPNVTIVDTGFKDGYHSVKWICHACNRWDGASLRSDSDALPWIWANNPYADAGSDDPDKPLDRHMFYGNFFMDMRAGKVEGDADPTFPKISAKRVSASAGLTSDIGGGSHGGSSIGGYALHGALMALAFGLLYPGGVAALLSGHDRAVKYHMFLQGGTAAIMLIGAAIGTWRTMATAGLGGLFGLHTAIGVAVTVALVAQGVLGWRNHEHYVNTGSPAPLRAFHAYLGRGVWAAGAGNALLGLTCAHSSSPRLPAAWVLLLVLELGGYLYLRRRKQSRSLDTIGDDDKEGYMYGPVHSDDGFAMNRRSEEA
jgi:hypothetical protein